MAINKKKKRKPKVVLTKFEDTMNVPMQPFVLEQGEPRVIFNDDNMWGRITINATNQLTAETIQNAVDTAVRTTRDSLWNFEIPIQPEIRIETKTVQESLRERSKFKLKYGDRIISLITGSSNPFIRIDDHYEAVTVGQKYRVKKYTESMGLISVAVYDNRGNYFYINENDVKPAQAIERNLPAWM